MKFILLLCIIFTFSNSAVINIFYNNTTPSDVQDAVSTAVNNIQQFFVLNFPINLGVQYVSLGSVLADVGTGYYCAHPQASQMLIPPALYVQMTGVNCAGSPNNIHLNIRINSDPSANWYTGTTTSGLTSSQNDLVTYVMHFMVHGLGMISGIGDGNGNNLYGNRSLIFDYFVFGTNHVASWPGYNGTVPSPAVTDTSFLTGSKLTFAGNYTNFGLYTPSTFSYGTSIQHRSTNSLMYYQISKGQYWRVLDKYIWGMFRDFGYNMTNCASPDSCGNCISGNPCFLLSSPSSNVKSFLFDFF